MKKLLPVVLVFTFGLPIVSLAQETVTDDNTSELVSQAEEFRKQPETISTEPAEKPEITVQEEEAPAEEAGPVFFVKKIIIEGNTLFSDEDLAQYTDAFENTKVDFGRLKVLTRLITNHYRAAGYLTSRAFLPPQEIKDDAVIIQVIEGKVGEIFVEGNRWFSPKSYADAIRLSKGRVLRYQDIETSLYFLNRKKDRKTKAYVIAGKELFTSDIILKAEEKNPFHIHTEFNNRGTKLTHRARQLVYLEHNSVTGRGDALNANFSMAQEGAFDAVSLSYELPVESARTIWGLDTSYAQSMLMKHLKSAEVKGLSKSITPSITQNFIRTPAFQMDGYLGFEIKDSKTDIDDLKTSYDRMRVLRAGPRFIFEDRRGKGWFSGDIHWGIPDILGGSEADDLNASRLRAGGDFIYGTVNATRLHRLTKSSFLILKTSSQWSAEPLTSLEQFRLGGAYTVRGYPESDAIGDYGYNASVEFNAPLHFLPKTWSVPWTKNKWFDCLRWAAFVDSGKTFNHERGLSTNVKDKFLLGMGTGLRFDMNHNISIQADWGYPLGDDSSDKDRPQWHLSFKAGF